MHKIEIFLPLPGKTKAMDEYFTELNVIYLDGLPTGQELPSAELTEAELVAIGLKAAKAKVDRLTGLDPLNTKDYIVDPEITYIDEFTDEAGDQIGWQFEFAVYED